MRIGFASDIHRLVVGRKLILGGVVIPSKLGEWAHSDGDVVYHAIAESILGALSLGDLGKYFPSTDENKDLDSSKIVSTVYQMMNDKYYINNIDITITLENIMLSPYIDLMRKNISFLLHTDIENVSVKACSNEGLDSLGKSFGVKADCVVLLNERGS